MGTERRKFNIKTSEGVFVTIRSVCLCRPWGCICIYTDVCMRTYIHIYTSWWSVVPRAHHTEGWLFHTSNAPPCLQAQSSLAFLCHLRLSCGSVLSSISPIFFWPRIHIYWYFWIHLGNVALFAQCFRFHFPLRKNSTPAFFPGARKLSWGGL